MEYILIIFPTIGDFSCRFIVTLISYIFNAYASRKEKDVAKTPQDLYSAYLDRKTNNYVRISYSYASYSFFKYLNPEKWMDIGSYDRVRKYASICI